MIDTKTTRPSLVVMGVAGCGKSTLGRALARQLHLRFLDADDLHPPSNVEKMRNGIPLTDADREGWLAALADSLRGAEESGEPVVLACSALKARYRTQLGIDERSRALIYLRISPRLARERLLRRSEHFMPASLVESQFATLEEPGEALTLDASAPLRALVVQALEHYRSLLAAQ